MSELIGKKMGDYEILEQVGQGGVASVYRARDSANSHDVALKVLAPQLAMDATFRERFKREAEVLSELEHPHIVPILDFGEAHGLTFIVLPFMQVGSLTDVLKNGPLEVPETLPIIEQIATALQHAHDAGVVHRDVKPSNVLMDGDQKAWLSDFGFAHVHHASLSLTGSTLIGTPAYMSPEQVRGEGVTPCSDQYSLGMVLYQMTTGYLPYEAETPMATAIRQATEPLPRPRWLNPEIPDAVEAVMKRALSKRPEDRYESVTAFYEALVEAVEASYDPETGELLPDAIGQDPVTEVFDSDLEYALTGPPWYRRRVARVAMGLLALAVPLAVWGFSAYTSDASSRALSAAQTEVWNSIMASSTAGGAIATEDLPTVIAANLTALAGGGLEQGTGTPSSPESESLTMVALASMEPSHTPTSTWTATHTPTITPLPPTWTASPRPTNTKPPPPPPPPPTVEDPCTKIKLLDKAVINKKVSVTFKNGTNGTVRVTYAGLIWPDDPGNVLIKIEVGDDTQRVNDGSSPSGASFNVSVEAGGSVKIQYFFEASAQASSYNIDVRTSNGCRK